MREWIQQDLGSVLTALSILAAIATWAVAFVRDRADRKMSHTADVVANLSTNDRLAEANYQMFRIIKGKKTVSVGKLDEDTERYIVDILNYYEYLCEMYKRKVLDKETIVHLRGKLMRQTYEACEHYIRISREDQKRPELYLRFEELAKELNRSA